MHRLKSRVEPLFVGATRGREPTSGLPLPPRLLRAAGAHFRADAEFVAAGRRDARRLVDRGLLDASTRLLDLGCGAGRLAIGVTAEVGTIASYRGIDVDPTVIAWCDRHLTSRAPHLEFRTVDVRNARYNPSGAALAEGFALPAGDAAFDTVYAYSLFSHMEADDVAVYCADIARVLAAGGAAMLTAFVEDGVVEQAVNPPGYGPITWRGALHCVRFERGFFESLLSAAGLAVVDFRHGGETDGQSLYVAAPAR